MNSKLTDKSVTSFACVILAAGKGTRMRSSLPKLMHQIANKPIIKHVLDNCVAAGAAEIIIVISPDDLLTQGQIGTHGRALQREALGTGHAALLGVQALKMEHDKVLILNGDMPLLLPETLQRFAKNGDPLTIMAMHLPDGRRLGRVVLNATNHVEKIIEYKDATDDERAITLINTGVYAIQHERAESLLTRVDNKNAAREYYLTDIVTIGQDLGLACGAVVAEWDEVASINNKAELAEIEAMMQQRLRQKHLDAGITLIDPSTIYFSMDTAIGMDSIIEPNVFFGPSVTIGKGVHVKAFSHLEGATIKDYAQIGPFARLRPDTTIGENARIGNFVEIKKTTVGEGTKINHFTYAGDATIGDRVNIGAFAVTCNYNGFSKFQTTIEDNVLVGAHSVLIAPLTIGKNAMTAAGSVITHDVQTDALAIARPEQINKAMGAKIFRDKRKKDKH